MSLISKQPRPFFNLLQSQSKPYNLLLSIPRPIKTTSVRQRYSCKPSHKPNYSEEKRDMSKDKDFKVKEAIESTHDEPQQIDTIASIRGWFGPDNDSPYYPLIKQYLASSHSLSETASKLSDTSAKEKSKKEGSSDLDLLYSILHSAKRIPWRNTSDHAKLVDLVKRLKDDVDNFQGLPQWGMAFREVWNDCPGVGAGYSEPEAHAWANINYFCARMEQEKMWGNFEPLYGLWAMRDALEEEVKDDGPNDAHIPGTTAEKYNAKIPAAAVWAIALGKSLYDFEKDMTPKEANYGNPARGGKLWKGKAEFSKERWAFWKKRFGEISQKEEPSEDTRKIANEAYEAMEQAEES